MAYNLKITVYNNRDYEQTFTLDSDNGAVNLTDCSLIFAISTESRPIVHTSGTTNNKCIFVTDPVNGQIKLSLPYAVLKTIEPGTHNHELLIVDAQNKRSGVWAGQLIIKEGVAL